MTNKGMQEVFCLISILVRWVVKNNKLTNVKVLVADDMSLNQLLIKIILEDFGLECDIAENGKIAIKKLQNSTYDIVLMDIQMPEINGFETSEFIRKR